MSKINGIEVGNCEVCPELMHCFQAYDDMKERAKQIAEIALDPALDEMTGRIQETMFQTISFEEIKDIHGRPFPDASEMAAGLRKRTAEHLDHIDEHKEEILDGARMLTAFCEGPLKMRATKAGRVITATVCASQSQPDGFSCEATHLDRKDVD